MLKNFRMFKETALIWLPLAILALIADQLCKYLAVSTLSLGESISIFPGLNFTLVYNYGSAFGFLNRGVGWQQLFFVIIAIVATVGFSIWLSRIPRKNIIEGLGIAFLLSGAVGNLIDRLYYGYVIDFIDVYISTWHWYAFNLADSFICVGAALVMLEIYKSR